MPGFINQANLTKLKSEKHASTLNQQIEIISKEFLANQQSVSTHLASQQQKMNALENDMQHSWQLQDEMEGRLGTRIDLLLQVNKDLKSEMNTLWWMLLTLSGLAIMSWVAFLLLKS